MENLERIEDETVSIGNWLVTYLIMCIPIVNIVMLFVWAFSDNSPKSKSNWAKASLIWMAIGIVLCFLFFSSIAALFVAAMN